MVKNFVRNNVGRSCTNSVDSTECFGEGRREEERFGLLSDAVAAKRVLATMNVRKRAVEATEGETCRESANDVER